MLFSMICCSVGIFISYIKTIFILKSLSSSKVHMAEPGHSRFDAGYAAAIGLKPKKGKEDKPAAKAKGKAKANGKKKGNLVLTRLRANLRRKKNGGCRCH